ncbi:MAG: hypothetical protein H6R40_809 [Gemmatimonadetes bacterium]|nr:hypothetical protein [Gemmatimonadota bacterium]
MPEVMNAPQSSPPFRRLPALLAALLVLATSSLVAQSQLRLQGNAPFHAEPRGTQLGTLQAGTTVALGRTTDGWREATFEGWIFAASTGPANRSGYNLAIAAVEGENLRSSPNGTVIGRAVQGTQLNLLERRGGWVRVRRSVWLPPSALPAQSPARPTPAAVAPPTGAPPAVRVVAAEDTLQRVLIRKGSALLVGPGGAAVGPAPEELPGRVTDRSGNWVRVRTETWVREDDIRPAPDSAALTLEQLQADPDKYVGTPVAWRLQFLSVQTADELRPELPAGEPYVLARGPLPAAGFVYVVVTRAQAERFRSMNPLDEFQANGIIRAGRTRYLPTPVIELQGGR